MKKTVLMVLLLGVLVTGCSSNDNEGYEATEVTYAEEIDDSSSDDYSGYQSSSSYSDQEGRNYSAYDEEESEDGYEDGTRSATVNYYNPRTGTRSTYTLDVDVEDNEVTKIHWPNGGYTDESHFSSEDISS